MILINGKVPEVIPLHDFERQAAYYGMTVDAFKRELFICIMMPDSEEPLDLDFEEED